MLEVSLKRRKRIRNMLLITIGIFFSLIIRIGWIQLIQGEELQAKAYTQQTMDRSINPKRGTIYDNTGKTVLAVSATVETVSINPTNIAKEDKEKLAKALANIFELDYETVLKKVEKRSSIETIAKRVDKDKTNELRKWLNENNITNGVNIDEDTKRYYPYNNLASHVIGFCGSDNQGLDGIEAIYDDTLKGEKGKIAKIADGKGGGLLNEGEEYIPAVDGKDIVLSINMSAQAIVEKYLKEACIDNACTDGGNIIVMNPKTGDILAMATYPDYNLNEPYEPNTEELKNIWDTLSSSDKNTALQKIWRNKAIADSYEPGSTFKLVTASAALEEGITTTDKAGEFNCTGGIEVAGVRIKCWRYYRPHGAESLRQALMNSCNPVFIGLGQKIGKEKYYNYLEKFGLLDYTHIKLTGEAKGIFLPEAKVGPVELATISFGQRFEVTPLQMVRMASAIANGGILMEPRIVKQIIDSNTGEVENIEPREQSRAISEETAKQVLSMMESVVAEGTGKNAQVKGYRIGGKTGTSEDGVNTGKYVTSFIGVAPISNPQVVILITLYNPTGEGGHQGGGVAAPIASQVLSELLPALEIMQDNTEQIETRQEVTVPEVRGLTIEGATKLIEENGLDFNLNTDTEKNKAEKIKDQMPKPGLSVYNGTKIELYI
ncbi:MAG: PASTA domain-containing protein [Clostridia bacterium]|nr:PASTA domain-containing protein [Clostridia bacterium]